MPKITIEISEEQEARITDLIDSRQHFAIEGGRVMDSDGKLVFLKRIEFTFMPDSFEELGQLHRLGKKPVVILKPDG